MPTAIALWMNAGGKRANEIQPDVRRFVRKCASLDPRQAPRRRPTRQTLSRYETQPGRRREASGAALHILGGHELSHSFRVSRSSSGSGGVLRQDRPREDSIHRRSVPSALVRLGIISDLGRRSGKRWPVACTLRVRPSTRTTPSSTT